MPVSRRTLIQSGVGMVLASSLPRVAFSELKLGSSTLTTVSDGNLTLPASFIFEPMPQDEL